MGESTAAVSNVVAAAGAAHDFAAIDLVGDAALVAVDAAVEIALARLAAGMAVDVVSDAVAAVRWDCDCGT